MGSVAETVLPLRPVTVKAPVLARLTSPVTATSVATVEPFPTHRCALVNDVLCLLLNVVKSAEAKYPFVEASDFAIDKVSDDFIGDGFVIDDVANDRRGEKLPSAEDGVSDEAILPDQHRRTA